MNHETLFLSWQLEPVLVGGLVAAAVAYYLAVGPLRARIAPGERYPTGRAVVFGLGLIMLFLNEGSPLHDLAERYLLSAHMVQHLLLSYAVAPVVLMGVPTWLLKATLTAPRMLPVSKVVLNPLVCFLFFSLVMGIYHVPAVYDLALANTSLHHAVHFVILIASLMMWWPLIGGLPELPKLPYLTRAAYIFLLPVAQLPIFAGVTFSDTPLYSAYAVMPVRAYGLAVMEDQALAGIIMKIFGLLAFGTTFIVTFVNWYRAETSTGSPNQPSQQGAGL